jgi:hypothetical protein
MLRFGVLPIADQIMETLKIWGIEFVCVGYIERTSVGNTECSSSVLYTL